MNTPMKYKRYEGAFKRLAVEHLLVSGKPVRVITHEPGVNVRSLMQWKQAQSTACRARCVRTLDAVEAENWRLRREVESLVWQHELL